MKMAIPFIGAMAVIGATKYFFSTADVPFEDGTVIGPGVTYVVTASVDASAKCVVFQVDNQNTFTANVAPFEYWGNSSAVGNHIFTATPWSNIDGTGTRGETVQVNFVVSPSVSPTPTETPVPTPFPTETPVLTPTPATLILQPGQRVLIMVPTPSS